MEMAALDICETVADTRLAQQEFKMRLVYNEQEY